ncbi:hypothetical protein VTO42DRAFT_3629 [Malbranchea cinnamomea]
MTYQGPTRPFCLRPLRLRHQLLSSEGTLCKIPHSCACQKAEYHCQSRRLTLEWKALSAGTDKVDEFSESVQLLPNSFSKAAGTIDSTTHNLTTHEEVQSLTLKASSATYPSKLGTPADEELHISTDRIMIDFARASVVNKAYLLGYRWVFDTGPNKLNILQQKDMLRLTAHCFITN